MNPLSNRGLDYAMAVLGFFVALPAIYFFIGSFLKYELNLFPNVEIIVPPPWVLIGGLLMAIILNLVPLFRMKASKGAGFTLGHALRVKMLNVAMASIAFLFLSLLLSYVLLENLAERKIVSHVHGGQF